MSRPEPLQAYIAHEAGDRYHFATLYDPATGKVLMTAQEASHDAALERLLMLKRHSKFAKRRYVVKSNRPKAVLGLLELIDFLECTEDADSGTDGVFIPIPVEDVLLRLRAAIAAIEGTAA